MSLFLFTGGWILDPRDGRLRGGVEVLVEDKEIREVSDRPIQSEAATRVPLGGRVLMPGLIDAHVHVVAAMANLAANALQPSSLAAFRAAAVMRGMLMRGFTTVRDLAGADRGLADAQAMGLFDGPRLIVCGKALSQTGGHSDGRARSDNRAPPERRVGTMGRLVDGVDAVRRAAREELREGADFIKVMANGGVASPTDPIHFLGFSREEISAAVEEARNAGTYVSAHLYTDEGIRRAVECGVHSLEHCNLITEATARFAAEQGAVAVPTLVTYDKLSSEGEELGIGAEAVAKVDDVRLAGMESLARMQAAGLPMAYGSDLLGAMHRHQSEEFVIRGKVLPPQMVIAAATHIAAKLCRMEGRIGTVAAGAHADLIVVDGNPLEDLSLLTFQGRHMPMILKGGVFMKGG